MSEYRDTIARDKIKSMMNEGIKTFTIYDASDRAEEVYEAGLHAVVGDPCLITLYKYIDGAAGSSRQVLAYEERIGSWTGYETVQVGAGNDINNLL
jgi:hypothetical protein